MYIFDPADIRCRHFFLLKKTGVNYFKYYIFVLIAIIFLLFLSSGTSQALRPDNRVFSVEFKNARLSEMLDQLAQLAGIHIFVKNDEDNRIYTKVYKDETIEEILMDLMRNSNRFLVWHYGENGLVAVDIWIFDVQDNRFSPASYDRMDLRASNAQTEGLETPDESLSETTDEKAVSGDTSVEDPDEAEGSPGENDDSENEETNQETDDVEVLEQEKETDKEPTEENSDQ